MTSVHELELHGRIWCGWILGSALWLSAVLFRMWMMPRPITLAIATIGTALWLVCFVNICTILVPVLFLPTSDFKEMYKGSAYKNIGSTYPKSWSVLTENQNWQTGVIWSKRTIRWPQPLVADFLYQAGGGTGGDGFVFMFYKASVGNNPPGGGDLGFKGPGYGIEFDSYSNPYDPPSKHIALIKDCITNHLAYKLDERVADNKWHRAIIVVDNPEIHAYIDGTLVLSTKDLIKTDYGGFGFSAATGKANNYHNIANVWVGSLYDYIEQYGDPRILHGTLTTSNARQRCDA